MNDALIEAGQSDALIEAVVEALFVSCRFEWRTGHATLQECQILRYAAAEVVTRLRAGGISDLVIGKCLCGDGFVYTPAIARDWSELEARILAHYDTPEQRERLVYLTSNDPNTGAPVPGLSWVAGLEAVMYFDRAGDVDFTAWRCICGHDNSVTRGGELACAKCGVHMRGDDASET